MKKYISLFVLSFVVSFAISQTNTYEISFENAVHHEARITASFPDLKGDTLTVRMSRTSPGRYALHEFAKNVYAFVATDSKGTVLPVKRPNPYAWIVTGHDGTVNITYTLFANRGGGTYSQVDETHAHLNIPATFMYAPALRERKIHVNFKPRADLNWKIATQLSHVSGTTFSAFMDSPTEISNHQVRSFDLDGQIIKLSLHHNGTESETDQYFEQVKKVVLAEKAVFGELPNFDFNTYNFLACYIPNASGDGMEHRNSTILTSTRSLENGGMERNIGTVSHEFFHAWNVERIRPKTLEPFNFKVANMSGALWFAEGFTSYYTNLILCRAGIISPEKYVEGLSGAINYVWNSPARQFFNPIEMSYQAPFVDAATSVDPVNRENTFISYYSYGSVLGLALDLSLRNQGLHLDGFMKSVWEVYGKREIPYTIQDLHKSLIDYAGSDFGNTFFSNFIYTSGMPNYKKLLASVGVTITQDSTVPSFGANVFIRDDGTGLIRQNTKMGSAAYHSGLDKGDIITAINKTPLASGQKFPELIKQFSPGDILTVDFTRYGLKKSVTVQLQPSSSYSIQLQEKNGEIPDENILKNRTSWLKTN